MSLVLICVVLAGAGASAQPPILTERVTVARMLLDVRVVDQGGRAVRGLGTGDFSVTIGGRAARVESVEWIGEAAPTKPGTTTVAPATGRAIVFFVQTHFERERLATLMRVLVEARTLLRALTPADRVAVLSYDSRLRVWTDFTADAASVERLLDSRLLLSDADPQVAPGDPPLTAHLSPSAAGKAHAIEDALVLLGEALGRLPGTKTVIFLGHGFGQYSRAGLMLPPAYDRARAVLRDARASVFCLDVMKADQHSHEGSLQQLAADTGGTYARTHLFPARAIAQVAEAVAGHYVLFAEAPPLSPGTHTLEIAAGHGRIVVSRQTNVVVPR